MLLLPILGVGGVEPGVGHLGGRVGIRCVTGGRGRRGGSGGERRERRARDESPTHGIGSNRGDGETRGARGRRRRLDARRGDRPMIGIGLKISPRRARHSGGARTGVAAGGLGGVHGALGHRAEATGQRGSGAEDTGHLGAWRCAQLVVRLRAFVRSQPVLTRSAPIGTGCASPARGPARARNPPALHLTGPEFAFCEGAHAHAVVRALRGVTPIDIVFRSREMIATHSTVGARVAVRTR